MNPAQIEQNPAKKDPKRTLTKEQIEHHEGEFRSTRRLLFILGIVSTAACGTWIVLKAPQAEAITSVIGVIGTVVSGLSIWLTWKIAKDQDLQLRGAENVASQIRELVKQQNKNDAVRARTESFFLLHHTVDRNHRFKLFRLHGDGDDPLEGIPAIAYTPVSEDHVVNVIQKHFRLANREVDIKEYTKGTAPRLEDAWSIVLSCRGIGPEHSHHFPAWIEEEKTEGKRPQAIRRLRRKAHGRVLPPVAPICVQGVISDSAIVARISIGQKKVFVIDGQTQYGTWIAGIFLDQLLETGKQFGRAANKCLLHDDVDFIAVIDGSISEGAAQLAEPPHVKALFRKDDNSWRYVDPTDESPPEST